MKMLKLTLSLFAVAALTLSAPLASAHCGACEGKTEDKKEKKECCGTEGCCKGKEEKKEG